MDDRRFEKGWMCAVEILNYYSGQGDWRSGEVSRIVMGVKFNVGSNVSYSWLHDSSKPSKIEAVALETEQQAPIIYGLQMT